MTAPAHRYRRQWRDYRTRGGNRPVRKFMMELESDERAEIVAAMKEVAVEGLRAARHLSGDLYEVRADVNGKFFRLIFATEGRYSQVLLSLEVFAKKSNKTPAARLALASRRLNDWRRR